MCYVMMKRNRERLEPRVRLKEERLWFGIKQSNN